MKKVVDIYGENGVNLYKINLSNLLVLSLSHGVYRNL